MKLTKNNIEIETTNEDFNNIKKHFEGGQWKPEMGKKYWRVSSIRTVDLITWNNDEFDNSLLDSGNCHQTREKAEEYRQYLLAVADVRKYIRENDLGLRPDWGNREQKKYLIWYDNGGEKSIVDYWYGSQYQTTIGYLKSLEYGKQLIKAKEKELKTIFTYQANNL